MVAISKLRDGFDDNERNRGLWTTGYHDEPTSDGATASEPNGPSIGITTATAHHVIPWQNVTVRVPPGEHTFHFMTLDGKSVKALLVTVGEAVEIRLIDAE